MIRKQKNKSNKVTREDRVEIAFYTDPLCCWSWALQPHLFKLLEEYQGIVSLRLYLGGLIKDWKQFSDPINNISKPSQMGPLWMDAARKTGVFIDESLWVNDPPLSSYPACIAVKTAELQSEEAGLIYYKAISEAAMTKGLNIAKPEVLVSVAKRIAEHRPEIFDLNHFLKNYNNLQSRQAFKADLQQVRFHNIGRFPTIVMKPVQGRSIIMTGYRDYEVLIEALEHVIEEGIIV